MSKIESLKLSVAKAEAKVEKVKGTIKRHEATLEKKLNAIKKKGVDLTRLEAYKWDENGRGTDLYWEICDIESKQAAIKEATKKLREAEAILENWKLKLEKEVSKEDFLNAQVPEVIKSFLENWKVMAYEWHVHNFKEYKKLKKTLEEMRYEAMVHAAETLPEFSRYLDENGKLKELYKTPHNIINLHPRRALDEYLKSKKLDSKSIAKRLSFFGAVIAKMDTFFSEKERLTWLNKVLEEDKREKMLDLINRVKEVAGEIQDASNLRVDERGNLNGVIQGTKSKVKIETIGAGGWNIQCFHYRTLVHKMD